MFPLFCDKPALPHCLFTSAKPVGYLLYHMPHSRSLLEMKIKISKMVMHFKSCAGQLSQHGELCHAYRLTTQIHQLFRDKHLIGNAFKEVGQLLRRVRSMHTSGMPATFPRLFPIVMYKRIERPVTSHNLKQELTILLIALYRTY